MVKLVASCFLGLVMVAAANAVEPPHRSVIAHAHNDYLHATPLHGALALGCGSIEADVHLVDGRLLVAHDRAEVRPDRTLENLYLSPLAERVKRNEGWVVAPGQSLILLIDVKSEAEPAYRTLHTILAGYAGMLTTFGPEKTRIGAVTVIVSGNRAPKLLAEMSPRYASLDGRVEDIDGELPPEMMPLISVDWRKTFIWQGADPQPVAEREQLARLVGRVHAQGRKLRFWNTPDRPEVWRMLRETGVDLIGSDDLVMLRAFLGQE